MTEQQLANFVISRFGQHLGRNDIIFDLCRTANIQWPEGEKIVEGIERHYRHEIAKRENHFVSIMNTGIITIAFILASISTWLIITAIIAS